MSKRKTKAYKAKRQEESTSKVLLKSRIEALQKELGLAEVPVVPAKK